MYFNCINVYIFFHETCRDLSTTNILQQLNKSLRHKQKNKQTNYHIRLVTSVNLTLGSALHSPTSPQSLPCNNILARGTITF
jgi:hypothetical protein